jgi:type IV pilus assembly protein PilE
MKRMQKDGAKGFSLMELLVAIVIIGILSAVALPAYNDYVTRGRLTEAYTSLSGVQPVAEQFWANNRSYVNLNTSASFPQTGTNFDYALSNATASTYTVTATGKNRLNGFVFTIDQNGARATTGVPSGWTTNAACWVDRKSGQCTN